jgi:glycosyltransferase involved in cell wall biosynthesis
MRMIDLDIVQPCYNPFHGWEQSVWIHFENVLKLLSGVNVNLIIVNDGSQRNITDEAVTFLRERISNFQFISYEQNRGKGYALRQGLAVSRGPFQICTDIDFPYELIDIKQIYELLKGDADIVCGVRTKTYYDTLPFERMIASNMSQILNKMFLRLPFSDTQSGLKGFNRKGREIMLSTIIERYLADTEFLAIAAKTEKITIVPYKVSLRDNITLSKMGVRIFLAEFQNFLHIYSIVR